MQQLPVLGVGRHAHTLQPDRVAADGEEDCVELVHELGAVIILGGRIELESEIDVRVTGPDTITIIFSETFLSTLLHN